MKTIQYLFAASVLYVVSTAAYAEDWYILAAVGSSQAQDLTKSSADNELLAIGVTGLESSVDDNTNGFKMQLGYRVSPNFAIESGYVDFGHFRYQATFNGGDAELEFDAWGVNLTGVGILPLGEQLEVFGKLGLVLAMVDAKSTVHDLGTEFSDVGSASTPEVTFGVGANYNFADFVTLRAEWERYVNVGDDSKTGESDIDLFTIGLAFGF